MQAKELKAFLAEKFAPLPELIGPGVLPKGHVMFLYGDEGTWKSWLLIDLAMAMSRAGIWLMWWTIPNRVLLVNPEMLESQYQKRLRDFTRKRGLVNGRTPEGVFVATDLDLRLDTAFGISQLEQAIVQHQIDTIMLDGLFKFVTTDVVSGADARRIIDNLDRLRLKYGATIILVHHTRQGIYDQTEGRTVQLGTAEMYGSSLYRDWADTILKVDKEEWREDLIHIWPQKHRHAEYPPTQGVFVVDRARLKFWLAY